MFKGLKFINFECLMLNMIDKLLKEPDVDPQNLTKILEDSINGIRKYYTLLTAVEMGLFDHLKSPKTIDELSKLLNCNKKLLNLFCEALCEMGLLNKVGEAYVCNEISRTFLTSDSFYSQTIRIRNTKRNVELWLNLREILKNGPIKRISDDFFATTAIHSLAQGSLLGELQRTVRIVSNLPEFKMAKKLLDLGGGHGLYAIAFTAINEDLEAYVLDLPAVVNETKKYIEKFGANRVHVIAGNFFTDDLGGDYDIVFSSYNPGGKKAELIPKIYNSLRAGGLYINKQAFPDNDQPLIDLEWNLWYFGLEKGKRRYTFKDDLMLEDYLSELEKIGFKILDVVNMGNDMDKMIVAKKL